MANLAYQVGAVGLLRLSIKYMLESGVDRAAGVGEAAGWIAIAAVIVVRSMSLVARLAHNASLRDCFPSAAHTPKAQ